MANPARECLTGHSARRKVARTERVVWDSELTGFGLRTWPNGTRSWIVKFTERGRQKIITLGSASDLNAGHARAQARIHLARIAKDGLPKRVAQHDART